METLTWVLFESPAVLSVVLGLVLFVLLVLWRRGGSPRPLLIGLAASAALLVVQALVVTHRERAGATLDAIAESLERGRTAALETALSNSFDAGRLRGEPLNRARFIEYVQNMVRHVDVVWTQRVDLDLTSDSSDRFVAEAGFLAEIATGEARGAFRSRWSLTFERVAGQWLITGIEPISIEGMPAPTWERISRE